MKEMLIMVLMIVGLTTQVNNEADVIDDLDAFIEDEIINKSTTKIVEMSQDKVREESAKSLRKYIKGVKKQLNELKKSDPIKVSKSKLKVSSLPKDYFLSMDVELIKEARKYEKDLKSEVKKVKEKQEEHRRKEEERKREEERRRQEQAARSTQSNSHSTSHSRASSGSSGGTQSRPRPQSQPRRQAQRRPASNIPIGVTHGAPTSSQLSASERARRENLVYSTLNRLPAASRAGVKEVRPVNKIKDGTYAGLTYWPAGIIEVALNWNDAVIIDTVIHEVGHTFHYNYGYHYSDEWEQIFAEEWAGKGYYGSMNKREAFAETFKIIYSPNHSTSQARSVIPKSIDYVLSKT